MQTSLLGGVKILEIGEYISAPFSTKIMAALGAEVIKIEPPGSGDPARRLGPFPDNQPDLETGALYLYLNTGKKSVTLNIATATGQHILASLASGSQLIVENLGPGVMQRLGLSYEILAEANPSLVLCSLSTFGQTGPYRSYAGDDFAAQAMGGIMYLTGDPSRSPLKIGEYTFSYLAGIAGFSGSLTALYGADVARCGQHVDVSTLEVVAASLGSALPRYQYTHTQETRGKSMVSMLIPCLDGFVMVTLAGDMWSRLAQLIGGHLAEDPRFLTEVERMQNFAEIELEVSAWGLQRNRKEAVEAGQSVGLAIDYLATVADVVDSPHYKARDFFLEIQHPKAGRLRYPGLPFTVNSVRYHEGRAPLLGEHNAEIYGERLGYKIPELVRLFAAGVI